MRRRKISEHVQQIAAVDWSRRLFDSLIPLPEGTTYNSYLVMGSAKTALIDSVDPTKADHLMEQLADVPAVDFIVANHAEQDHSGAIPGVMKKYPQAQVICSPKARGMLIDLLRIPADRIRTVDDGDTLSLGDRTLEFIHTPWVHWPETMCTFLQEDRVLFTCDFFGSHYAGTNLFAWDSGLIYDAAKRYYAEIMMPFRSIIRMNLQKIAVRNADWIAPGHGPVYDKPAFIVNAYNDWVSDNVRNEVVFPYISMHGSTGRMAEYLVDELAGRGIKVHLFDLAVTDIGRLAIALVDAATLIVGTPTIHAGPHPAVFAAAHLANALRPKLRYASVVGSYGWGGQSVEKVAGLIPNLKVEILPPVLCRGYPQAADLAALSALAVAVAERHRSLGA